MQQLQQLQQQPSGGSSTHPSADGTVSPFLVAGSGSGSFSGPPGIGRPSPVMNADDIFRMAGWSSPTPGAPGGAALLGGGMYVNAAGGNEGTATNANSPSPFSWRKGPVLDQPVAVKEGAPTGKVGTTGGEVNAENLDKVQQTLASMNQRGKGSGSMNVEGAGGSGGGGVSQQHSSSGLNRSQRSQDDHTTTNAHISIDVAAGSWQTTTDNNVTSSTTLRDSAEFSASETEMVVEKDLTGQFRDVSRSFQSQDSHGRTGTTGGNVLGEGEEKKDSHDVHRGVGGDDKSDEDDLDDDRGLESLPETYEEIYEISNRNRKRNKEKKRQRDGDDGDDGADVPQVGRLEYNDRQTSVFLSDMSGHEMIRK